MQTLEDPFGKMACKIISLQNLINHVFHSTAVTITLKTTYFSSRHDCTAAARTCNAVGIEINSPE